MKNNKTIFGILAGLAAGALLGVLFAPGKGTETRQKIADKSKKAFDRLKNKMRFTDSPFSDNNNSGI